MHLFAGAVVEGDDYRTDITFRDEAHLRRIIDRIVTRIGRRIDESSPLVDAPGSTS